MLWEGILPNTMRSFFLIVQNRNLSMLIKKQRPIISSAVLNYQLSIHLVGVSLMIPMEFSGRVRVNCFWMVP